MPAIRTPLLVAAFLTVALLAAASLVLSPRPSLAASSESEAATLPETADEPYDADPDADVAAEPDVAPADRDDADPVSDLSAGEPDLMQPALEPDAYEYVFPSEEALVKPEVSPDPGAAVHRDRDGGVSSGERRRWGLDEERARCLREMRAKYGWEPGDGALSADRFRLRFDPHTQHRYYERREADETWRHLWLGEPRSGAGNRPWADELTDSLSDYPYQYPGLERRFREPSSRYRSAPYIPGLRLGDDLRFPRGRNLTSARALWYD